MSDPTSKPPAKAPGAVVAEADAKAAAQAADDNKRRELVLERSIQLGTLIQAARNERQRRGEHASDGDIALFLAANDVRPPAKLDGGFKIRETWPRLGRVERLHADSE